MYTLRGYRISVSNDIEQTVTATPPGDTTASPGEPATSPSDTKSVPATQPPGYTDEKAAFLRRMRRIEGQVRGITRMIEEDVYCIDVITQVAAVTKALQAVSIGLVEEHLGHCVLTAAQSSTEEGNEKLREATEAIARLVRS